MQTEHTGRAHAAARHARPRHAVHRAATPDGRSRAPHYTAPPYGASNANTAAPQYDAADALAHAAAQEAGTVARPAAYAPRRTPAPQGAARTAQGTRTQRALRAKRRRRRLLRRALFCGALLAAALFVVIRAVFPVRSAPQDAETDVYLPAAMIPQEGPPYIIAIDAGHGGTDTGAQGFVTESTMTEATIGYLETWLSQDENYTPVRTHAYDTFCENTDRAATANDARAALLLSVHGNSAAASDRASGFECYPQPPGRTYHRASLYFAHLVAEKFGGAGQRLRGNAGVRYIYYVGDDAHGYEKEVVEERDETVRAEQTFGLLEKTDCPAVLAEQCFVTSASDVEAWGGDDGDRKSVV